MVGEVAIATQKGSKKKLHLMVSIVVKKFGICI
jgi:hypothetical protein